MSLVRDSYAVTRVYLYSSTSYLNRVSASICFSRRLSLMFSIKFLVLSRVTALLKWSKAATYWAKASSSDFFCSLLNLSDEDIIASLLVFLTLFSWLRKSLPALKVFRRLFSSFWVTWLTPRLFWADSRNVILFRISYILSKIMSSQRVTDHIQFTL